MDTLDFDDIFDIWPLGWWQDPYIWLLIIAIAISIVLLVYLGRIWWQRRKLLVDPRMQALKQLYALDVQQGLETQQDHKYFYLTLITVLKRYIDTTHDLASASKTGAEIVSYLQTADVDPRYVGVVRQLIEHGSPVKFAQAQGLHEQMTNDHQAVLDLLSRKDEKDTPS